MPKPGSTTKTFAAPLQPVPLPAAPWTKIGLDIVGPFETAPWNCRYAIALTDYYSKWPEVAFTASITSEVMIGFLANIFSHYGNPKCVVTDNGPQLISTALSTFFKDRIIRQIKVSVYHPASNGAVRFNRVLKSCLQAAIIQAAPWKETMTAFLQIYRPTPDSMTNVSPFELMFGRKMRTKLAVMPLPDCEHCGKKRGVRALALKVGRYNLYSNQICKKEGVVME